VNTFCILPWIHLLIAFSGDVYCCCRTRNQKYKIGNIYEKSIEEIINSREIKRIRVEMINNRKLRMCQPCYNDGAFSMRVSLNKVFFNEFNYAELVEKTSFDGNVRNYYPQYVELHLSNKCNFKCRTCNSRFSTSWNEDAIKINNGRYVYYPHKSIKNIQDIISFENIKWIRFAGGEPLISDEHYKLVEYLISNNLSKNISLLYNTNLSCLHYKKWDSIDLWKNFKHIKLLASIDDSYERGEYIRKGQKWSEIIKNRDKILNSNLDIEFKLFPLISIFNIWHLPDFISDWSDSGFVDKFSCSIIKNVDWLKIQILPNNFKDKIKEKYKKFRFPSHIQKFMYNIVGHLYSEDLYEKLFPKFVEMTTMIDKMRGENYLDIFEELRGL